MTRNTRLQIELGIAHCHFGTRKQQVNIHGQLDSQLDSQKVPKNARLYMRKNGSLAQVPEVARALPL